MIGNRERGSNSAEDILSGCCRERGRYSGAEVARFLSISTSAVNQVANADEFPEVIKIIG